MATLKTEGKWTTELKRKLVSKVLQKPSRVTNKELYEYLRPQFNNIAASTLQWTYYYILRHDPELVLSVAKELRDSGLIAREPYKSSVKTLATESAVDAESVEGVPAEDVPDVIASEEPVIVTATVTDTDEEKVFLSLSKLIDGLSSLGDAIDAPAFFDGLTAIVNKAAGAADVSLLHERDAVIADLTDKNKQLEEKNRALVEVLEYVSTTIGWFAGLSTGQKISNIGKITQDLRNSIFSYIKD
jgi:hypothetical protein